MEAAQDEDILAIAMSGPDYVAVFEGDSLTVNLLKAQDKKGVAIYPNPNRGQCTVRFPEIIENGTIEIINLDGEIIKKYDIRNSGVMDLSLSAISRGIYLIRVFGNGSEYKKRMFIE
jgi:hypothetical protein